MERARSEMALAKRLAQVERLALREARWEQECEEALRRLERRESELSSRPRKQPWKLALENFQSWSGVNGNGPWETTAYGYHGNSNQVHTLTQGGLGHQAVRTLEPYRDAVFSHQHAHGGQTPISTTYGRDELGRIWVATGSTRRRGRRVCRRGNRL